MPTLSKIARRVHQHLCALGVRLEEAQRFSELVDKWTVNNGPEWTASRLKSLRTALVASIASGQHYVVPPTWATRKNRKGETIFRDRLLHYIFSVATDNIKLSENALRIFQALKLETLSSAQTDKLLLAVEEPLPGNLSGPLNSVLEALELRHIPLSLQGVLEEVEAASKSMIEMIGNEKRSPTIQWVGKEPTVGPSKPRHDVRACDYVTLLTRDTATKSLWFRYPHETSVRIMGSVNFPPIETYETTVSMPAGNLTPLQEGGCKVRWVANPFLLYQALGEPLKKKLQLLSRVVYPEILVHDQDEGREQVLKWLREQKVVYSYDCTSFTDRLPLVLQDKILKDLVGIGVITLFDYDAFRLVIDKGWYFDTLKRELRWAVGQPLGFGPSFPLATLTHGVLLDVLDTKRTKAWRIVGDDIVIADKELASKYRRMMTQDLGVHINESKSTESDSCAEFLGKLIQRTGINPSTKVKAITSASQTLKLFEFYGPNAWVFFTNQQKRASLAGYAPTEVGGLGYKPVHISYSEWLLNFDVEAAARRCVEKEIESIHGGPTWDSRGANAGMELRVKFLEPAATLFPVLSESELDVHFGQKTLLNAFSGLPTLHARPDDESSFQSASPARPNTWVYLQDKAWYLNDTSVCPLRHKILGSYGYKSENEASSTLVNMIRYPTFQVRNRNERPNPENCRTFYRDKEGYLQVIQKEGYTAQKWC